MTWEQPTLIEIRMDAELTAYCDDLETEAAASAETTPSECESES